MYVLFQWDQSCNLDLHLTAWNMMFCPFVYTVKPVCFKMLLKQCRVCSLISDYSTFLFDGHDVLCYDAVKVVLLVKKICITWMIFSARSKILYSICTWYCRTQWRWKNFKKTQRCYWILCIALQRVIRILQTFALRGWRTWPNNMWRYVRTRALLKLLTLW